MNDGGGAALSINNSASGSAHKTLTNPPSSRGWKQGVGGVRAAAAVAASHCRGRSPMTTASPASPLVFDRVT